MIDAPKILVVGETCQDVYTYVHAAKISHEAPVLIGEYLRTEERIGMAGNVVANLKDLGANVAFLTLNGSLKDPSTIFVLDTTRQQIIKERIISEKQQLLRIDREDLHYISPEIEEILIFKFKNRIDLVDSILIQDYGKGLFTKNFLQTIISEARKGSKPVFVDPNPRTPWEWYKGCTLFKPNEREVLKTLQTETWSFQQVWDLVESKYIVITAGKDGLKARENSSGKTIQLYPLNENPTDVTGAGDSVIATLAFFMTKGYSFEESLALSNKAAAIAVGKFGTSTVSWSEIMFGQYSEKEDFTGDSF